MTFDFTGCGNGQNIRDMGHRGLLDQLLTLWIAWLVGLLVAPLCKPMPREIRTTVWQIVAE